MVSALTSLSRQEEGILKGAEGMVFLSTCRACSANGPLSSTCSASGPHGKLNIWPLIFCPKFTNFTPNLSRFTNLTILGTFWTLLIQNGPNFTKVAPILSKWPLNLEKISGLSRFPLAKSGPLHVKKKNHSRGSQSFHSRFWLFPLKFPTCRVLYYISLGDISRRSAWNRAYM